MKRLKMILSQILGIKEEEINDQTSPENVESWDSFNGLMLVSELEKKFNLNFTMDEVTEVRNVRDIINALKKHGIKLEGGEKDR